MILGKLRAVQTAHMKRFGSPRDAREQKMQNNDYSNLGVVAVLSRREDRAALTRIFSHSNWNLDTCGTLAETRPRLRDGKTGVVVSDSLLPDGDWKDLLDGLPTSGTLPRLIVAMPTHDARLWAEVLNLGGYDALVKPFDKDEVVRLVSLAWRSWNDAQTQTPLERRPVQLSASINSAAVAS